MAGWVLKTLDGADDIILVHSKGAYEKDLVKVSFDDEGGPIHMQRKKAETKTKNINEKATNIKENFRFRLNLPSGWIFYLYISICRLRNEQIQYIQILFLSARTTKFHVGKERTRSGGKLVHPSYESDEFIVSILYFLLCSLFEFLRSNLKILI